MDILKTIKDYLLIGLTGLLAVLFFLFKREREKYATLYHEKIVDRHAAKIEELQIKRKKVDKKLNKSGRDYIAAREKAIKLRRKYRENP
jgi:flagellar biosynthesis/type III secretory pathway M-ring protein FliF/YscJ